MTIHGQKENNIVFRFVVKGDLVRVADKIPDGRSLILCTKPNSDIKPYKNIFVYGGLDILYDMQARGMKGFMFSLGHNDGWYTHHPKLTISGEGS